MAALSEKELRLLEKLRGTGLYEDLVGDLEARLASEGVSQYFPEKTQKIKKDNIREDIKKGIKSIDIKHVVKEAARLAPQIAATAAGAMLGSAGGPIGTVSGGLSAGKLAREVLNTIDPSIKEGSPRFNKFIEAILPTTTNAIQDITSKALERFTNKDRQQNQYLSPEQQLIQYNEMQQQSQPQNTQDKGMINYLINNVPGFDALKNLSPDQMIKMAPMIISAISNLTGNKNQGQIGQILFGKEGEYKMIPRYSTEEMERIERLRRAGSEYLEQRLKPRQTELERITSYFKENPNLANAALGMTGSALGSLLGGGTPNVNQLLSAGVTGGLAAPAYEAASPYIQKLGKYLGSQFNK